MLKTVDLRDWASFDPPPNSHECRGLSSNGEHLYFLSALKIPNDDPNEEIAAYQLADQLCEGEGVPQWEELTGSICASGRHVPAFVALRDQLVLLHGTSDFDLQIKEYCLRSPQPKWQPPRAAPDPLRAPQHQHPVLIGDRLLLFGGVTKNTKDQFRGHQCVLGITVVDGRLSPNSADVNNLLPTPYPACGACSLLGTVAVAGGGTTATKKYSDKVYVHDRASQDWVPLPPLKHARGSVSLIYFKGQLFAFGGTNCKLFKRDGNWGAVAEQLSIGPAS